MRKGFYLSLVFLMILSLSVFAFTGCSKKNETSEVQTTAVDQQGVEETDEATTDAATDAESESLYPPMDPEAFKGYWWQVEVDDNGEVKDLKDNPVYWLEVNDDHMYFYTTSLNEDEGYGVAEKYYVLDGAYCYFDYDEITKDSYKQAVDSPYGGRFIVTFDAEDRLVITDYNNLENKDDGYVISYYVKVPATEWPIEE